MNFKGLWFYGLSGAGKSYLSNLIKKKISNSVLVDGDEVRKIISKDLGYSKSDREIQISRIYGICKILQKSNSFPIASSVYFNDHLNNLCVKSSILVLNVKNKNIKEIKKFHSTYKHKINVVGTDIKYPSFNTKKITNDFNKDMTQLILKKFFQNNVNRK